MAVPEIIYIDSNHIDVVETTTSEIIVTQEFNTDIITAEQRVDIITVGIPGPAGPPGPAGGVGAQVLNITAGEDIAANKVVIAEAGKVYLADKDTMTHEFKIVGITSAPYTSGQTASIFISGAITNAAWSFTDGIVYLSTLGDLTQTRPTSGFLVQVGVAVTSDTFIIDIDNIGYVDLDDIISGGQFT